VIMRCYLSDLHINKTTLHYVLHTKVHPKDSALTTRNENCKRYSSLPLGAVVSLFCESV
jgi:hypothetical protein